MNDYGWIALVVMVILLMVSNWYYIERIWDLKQSHHRDLNRVEAEYRTQDKMLKGPTLPMVIPGAADEG